ncbi:conserved hypothetical protein [Ricinus communis]|uniref:Uncharacterized protein n=1 Tax=Ricinus communis TaxID=3988 RepID=B9S1R5_RICCO|nr:conserved hypothetical protein [Ricinus communis]
MQTTAISLKLAQQGLVHQCKHIFRVLTLVLTGRRVSPLVWILVFKLLFEPPAGILGMQPKKIEIKKHEILLEVGGKFAAPRKNIGVVPASSPTKRYFGLGIGSFKSISQHLAERRA